MATARIRTEAQRGRTRWRDAIAPPAAPAMKRWAGRDASSRIAKKSRRRRESLRRDRFWTYFSRPTVPANSSRSDLRWPRRKLFEELDMMSVPLAGFL